MEPAFSLVIGPLLLLICFGLVLYGTFTTQVYFYWTEYKRDPRLIRFWVYVIWICETLHSVCCVIMLYNYFILNFGKEEITNSIFWSIIGSVFLEITIVGLCQSFYIYRIWRFSKRSYWVAVAPTVILVFRVALGYAALAYTTRYTKWSEFSRRKGIVPLLNTAFSCGVLVDVMTTSLLSYFLFSRRPDSATQARHIIDTLMFYTLNTGGITIVFSICILFMYNFMSQSLLWVGMAEIVGKLYANSMLVMLNARKIVRDRSDPEPGGGAVIPLSVLSRSTDTGRSPMSLQDGVRVDIFRETMADQNNGATRSVVNAALDGSPEKTSYAL